MSPAQREKMLKKYYLALRVLNQKMGIELHSLILNQQPSIARMKWTIQKAQEVNQINHLL